MPLKERLPKYLIATSVSADGEGSLITALLGLSALNCALVFPQKGAESRQVQCFDLIVSLPLLILSCI